jgi:imidazolonepropionase
MTTKKHRSSMLKPADTFVGPIAQLLPMTGLPIRGPIADESLEIREKVGVWIKDGRIKAILPWAAGSAEAAAAGASIEEQSEAVVALPGWIDAHTHICFAGSRARDYALRNAGKSYLEIAAAGGGIWDTVTQTRESSEAELAALTVARTQRLLRHGVTTVEVKSGYGLSFAAELRMLRAIRSAAEQTPATLIPTCLAAHMCPRDFSDSQTAYLQLLVEELFPRLQAEKLADRIDIFVEQSAFSVAEARPYLEAARRAGFSLTVHADQFTTGGSALAVELGATSADHLEVSGDAEIARLAASETVAVALPGASMGLGCAFTPARKLLDAGAILAIASDWNPGSAPMGNLLLQAAVLGAYEKLSNAEVLAAITVRAARALGLRQAGHIAPGMPADFQLYPTADYREVLYQQGQLLPQQVYKSGKNVLHVH